MKRFLIVCTTVVWMFGCAGACLSQGKPDYLDTSLPTAARVKDLMSRMTLEEEVSQIVVPSAAIDRLGVPEYDWRGECLHGEYTGDGVTCFPQAIGMGATFDPDLIHQVASAISDEAVAQHHWLAKQGKSTFRDNFTYWSPNINLYRDPRWGRGQETYSEDPYLLSVMGVAFVTGLQGNDPKYLKVASAPKHFGVHSGPDEIRTHFCAEVNAHDFWDTYMPAFEAAVKEAKAAGIMAAYSGINGVPCHANRTLLDDVLRKTWGFDGFVVSDGGGVGLLQRGQHYTRDVEDTAKTALMAGVDLENQRSTYPSLVKLVKENIVPESRIDEALARLLTVRFRVGLFDPPEMVPYTKLPYSLVGCEKHRQLALRTARESIVLLKNDGILPLAKGKYGRIAVIGPAADTPEDLYGNYFAGKPKSPVSLLEGIRNAAGNAEVIHAAGCGYTELLDSGAIPAAVLTPAGEPTGKHGLKAEYFDNTELKGKPVLTRIDQTIDFDWGERSPFRPPAHQSNPPKAVPADAFSVRWTGKLVPIKSGHYDLTLGSDDGSRLYLDGKLVVDNWRNGAANRGSYQVDLQAGKAYDLRVEYFDSRAKAYIHLSWKNTADRPSDFADAVDAAKQVDLVIATVGLRQNMSSEGRDWNSYALPGVQQKLLEALKATGKPLVVVLIGGNPIDLNWEHENANAVLQTWFPGQEGGTAVADVLFGKYNPSGRLPVTYYKSIEQLPSATSYAMKERTYRYFTGEALYPFGYGLSYTTFKYSGLAIARSRIQTNGSVEVTAKVTNTGRRAGDEVVQLYVSKDDRPDYAPLRQLRGVRRLSLKPGQTRTVTFKLTPKDFALVNERGDLAVSPGSYTIWVGGRQPEAKSIAQPTTTGILSGKITLSGKVNYLAKDRPFPSQEASTATVDVGRLPPRRGA